MHIAIIGSGSSAFAAAINAAGQGAQVTLIEKGTLGGTCVNVGCVPSKIFIRAAHIVHQQQHHAFKGIERSTPQIHRRVLLEQQQARVDELRKAKYEDILAKNPNVTLIQGTARFQDADTLRIETQQGEQTLKADRILIATGSIPHVPNIDGLQASPFWDSTQALQCESLPTHLVVLGGSVIAVELAQAFARLGSQVTVMARSGLLSKEDPELGASLAKQFADEKITVMTHTLPEKVHHDGQQFHLTLADKTITADKLLVATGRWGNTQRLNLQAAGVQADTQGRILVDEYCKTHVPHIYASGDCTTQPQYVYVAAAAGSHAAVNMLGGQAPLDLSIVPGVTFTEPQVATVGMTLAQARARSLDAQSRTLTLDNVPRALANFETQGFIKIVAERESGRILGAQIFGAEAGEMIQIISTAMHGKLTVDDLAAQLFPYLTMGEGLKLCAQIFRADVKELSCCAAVVRSNQPKKDAQETQALHIQRLLSEFNRLVLPPLKQRLSKLNQGDMKVYQAILQAFLEKGRPLTQDEMAPLTSDTPSSVLKRLKEADLVITDDSHGEVLGAYPMATQVTPHKVTVSSHQFYAICAFDALAISAMFGKETRITSQCHITGKQINLKLLGDKIISSEPPGIYLGICAQDSGQYAANSICKERVFLENEKVAKQWKATQDNVYIYTLDDALQLSIEYFASLLKPSATEASESGKTPNTNAMPNFLAQRPGHLFPPAPTSASPQQPMPSEQDKKPCCNKW